MSINVSAESEFEAASKYKSKGETVNLEYKNISVEDVSEEGGESGNPYIRTVFGSYG